MSSSCACARPAPTRPTTPTRCSPHRIAEADDFYASITPGPSVGAEQAVVMRQALAGMLWSKQYYVYDLDDELGGHRDLHPLRSEAGLDNERNAR